MILLLAAAGLVGSAAVARGQESGTSPQPKVESAPPGQDRPPEASADEVNKQADQPAEPLGDAVSVVALMTFSAAGLIGAAVLARLLVKAQTPSDPLLAASNDAWVQARLRELEASGKLGEPLPAEPDKAE